MFSKFLLPVMFLMVQSFLSAQEGAPAPPGTPDIKQNLPSDDLLWRVGYHSLVDPNESIWISSDLSYRFQESILVDFKDEVFLPRCELVALDNGGEPQQKQLLLSDIQSLQWTRRGGRDELLLHRFRIDIKQVYGELLPGRYRLQLVFPSFRATSRIAENKVAEEISSAVVEFTVRECRPPDAEKVWIEAEDVVSAQPTLIERTLMFTNHGKEPVHLQWYSDPRTDALGKVHSLNVSLWKWSCTDAAFAYLGNAHENKNIPYLTVLPGASLRFRAPDWLFDGDGYYQYSIDRYHGDATNPTVVPPRLLGTVKSDVFSVSRKRATNNK